MGDITKTEFPDDHFDVLTAISTIEHVGMGYFGDRVSKNADLIAMYEMSRILKEGGLLLLTTHIGKIFTITPDGLQRIYDRGRLKTLMEPLIVEKKEFYYRVMKQWHETTEDNAFNQDPTMPATVCLVLRKKSSM